MSIKWEKGPKPRPGYIDMPPDYIGKIAGESMFEIHRWDLPGHKTFKLSSSLPGYKNKHINNPDLSFPSLKKAKIKAEALWKEWIATYTKTP